jgi:hypothetical protein
MIMAKHKVYICNYDVSKIRVGDSRSTDYSYNLETETLTVWWRGHEVIRRDNVRPGDAFIISCYGGEPTMEKLHLPRSSNDFLLYILGFGNGLRCHDWRSYDEALATQRALKLLPGRTEYMLSGRYYALNVCEDSAGRPYHLAGIITEDLMPSEYLEILLDWPYEVRYPHDYLRIVIGKRLLLTEKQIDKVYRRWGWNYKA